MTSSGRVSRSRRGSVVGRPQHADAVQAHALLARVVVHEADRRVAELVVLLHLADHEPSRVARADDEHLFPVRDQLARGGALEQRPGEEPRAADQGEEDQEVEDEDRARHPEARAPGSRGRGRGARRPSPSPRRGRRPTCRAPRRSARGAGRGPRGGRSRPGSRRRRAASARTAARTGAGMSRSKRRTKASHQASATNPASRATRQSPYRLRRFTDLGARGERRENASRIMSLCRAERSSPESRCSLQAAVNDAWTRRSASTASAMSASECAGERGSERTSSPSRSATGRRGWSG